MTSVIQSIVKVRYGSYLFHFSLEFPDEFVPSVERHLRHQTAETKQPQDGVQPKPKIKYKEEEIQRLTSKNKI